MPGRKILVIDDDPDIISFLTALLQDQGYEPCSAKNGEEGWEKVRKEHPDLICLDLLMPQKSGVKLYGQIRKDPILQHIPVIMITGFGPPEYPAIDFKRFIHHRSAVPPRMDTWRSRSIGMNCWQPSPGYWKAKARAKPPRGLPKQLNSCSMGSGNNPLKGSMQSHRRESLYGSIRFAGREWIFS